MRNAHGSGASTVARTIHSIHHAQFEELGVIDGRWLHLAAWGRVRSGAVRRLEVSA